MLEIVSSVQNNKVRNNSAKPAQKFVSRLLAGCLLAVILGYNVDQFLHTTPWVMLALLVYVIAGSLYLLIKETKE